MIVLSGKVQFGLLIIENCSSQRNKYTYQGGSKIWQIEFFKIAATRSPFRMLIVQCDLDIPSRSEMRATFSTLEHEWPGIEVEVIFPRLGHKGDRFATGIYWAASSWNLTTML